MKKQFCLIALCLIAFPMSSYADDYFVDTYKKPIDQWGSANKDDEDSSTCLGSYSCRKKDEDKTDDSSTHQLENSFRQQGAPKGSLTGIMADQLKQR